MPDNEGVKQVSTMTIDEIASTLNGTILYKSEHPVHADLVSAAATDLMSGILSRKDNLDILITHLATPQAIRASYVFGIKAVILAKKKAAEVEPSLVEIANNENIILMATEKSMFESCGLLFGKGIRNVRA